MTADDLLVLFARAGIAATVTTSEHRGAHERADGAFDTLTLHLPDGGVTIGAAGENAYDVWLQVRPAPSQPA